MYIKEVSDIFSECGAFVTTFIFKAGESSKNLNTVCQLYEHLIHSKFDRKDILVALGGGVVGDLTGFAAATYLRGIDFIQLPTSLLSQVDSSIGGKTGVDFNAYKNMVGAFHQPKLVYIGLGTLMTLNEREYLSGMGEIIKHGLIKNKNYYEWLKNVSPKIMSRDLKTLEDMVYAAAKSNGKLLKTTLTKKESGHCSTSVIHSVMLSQKLSDFSLLHGDVSASAPGGAAYISFKKRSAQSVNGL